MCDKKMLKVSLPILKIKLDYLKNKKETKGKRQKAKRNK